VSHELAVISSDEIGPIYQFGGFNMAFAICEFGAASSIGTSRC
jgi:hypothetical protein